MFWEELTAPRFVEAVTQAQGVCVVPIAVIEKHGEHLPLGTDVYEAREAARRAAEEEPFIIFPAYYFGQILEARHEPGTIAIGGELQLALLQGICDEIARNGLHKIIFLNGHGGNNHLLPFFAQMQLQKPHPYTVYISDGWGDDAEKEWERIKTSAFDAHAGEMETSLMMRIRPDLVHVEAAPAGAGQAQGRLRNLPRDIYTGIWWYSDFPHHYAGEGEHGTAEKGEVLLSRWVAHFVDVVRAVKADQTAVALEGEFQRRSGNPLRRP